jgi:hypothetical protein
MIYDVKRLFKANRFGNFALERNIITRDWYPGVQKAMADVFVVRCEHDFASKRFVYTAVSPWFRRLDEGQRIPDYGLYVTMYEDGKPTYHFRIVT